MLIHTSYLEMKHMETKPKNAWALIILWCLMSGMFILWGSYSLTFVLDIPSWGDTTLSSIYPMLYVGTFLSTITWFVLACLLLVFAYCTLKAKSWIWTAGIIISTVFIVVLGFMLASFMVTAVLFMESFAILGLVTIVINFLIDLGILYFITRPNVKNYFGITV